MDFKKDYINFVLYNVLNHPGIALGQTPGSELVPSGNIGKILEKIISSNDFVKIAYLIGKTAGLELLFKYLLYISDKIDKSQITIFNLKDNFDYDVQNVKRICSKIEVYKSSSVTEVEAPGTEVEEPAEKEIAAGKAIGTIKVEADEQTASGGDEEVSEILESKDVPIPETEPAEEEQFSDSSFTLIGSQEINVSADSEVFELPDINQPQGVEEPEIPDETLEIAEKEKTLDEGGGAVQIPDEDAGQKKVEEVSEPFEFEVRTPENLEEQETGKTPEASEENTLEKLRSKFFEEVKILEKQMFHIEKDFKSIKLGKVKPSAARRLSEITLISGELSQLTKLLSMDDISRIFFSLSLYFAKVTETPGIITLDDLRLLLTSLEMANAVLKGEEYPNYGQLIKNVDDLRNNLSRKPEVKQEPGQKEEEQAVREAEHPVRSGIQHTIEEKSHDKVTAAIETEYPKRLVEVPPGQEPAFPPSKHETETVSAHDSANFKMRYLVKDFEKNFLGMSGIQGEYSKFDALEKIDELNNLLRMIARISASVEFADVLKLAEVSYVFLKYLKDYRMNVLEPEIQQIVKYIIFSFKMLLTNRKPEDFDILVQYLNNPVKIFTDS